jgi:uncharacterized membrane protein (UPF0127 family)
VASNLIALTRNGERVCPQCHVARTLLRRLKGLVGWRSLSKDEGFLLEPASVVHTWFVSFPVDVVFLDRDLRVLRLDEHVGPWRIAARPGARAVLELPAGTIARCALRVGDVLSAG